MHLPLLWFFISIDCERFWDLTNNFLSDQPKEYRLACIKSTRKFKKLENTRSLHNFASNVTSIQDEPITNFDGQRVNNMTTQFRSASLSLKQLASGSDHRGGNPGSTDKLVDVLANFSYDELTRFVCRLGLTRRLNMNGGLAALSRRTYYAYSLSSRDNLVSLKNVNLLVSSSCDLLVEALSLPAHPIQHDRYHMSNTPRNSR